MHPSDVKISRLTSNLLSLSSQVAAYSAAESKKYDKGVAEAQRAAKVAPEAEKRHRGKRRAAVVSWDLGHNPAGRAYVLYKLLEKNWEVDLVGPMWSRYGDQIWAPLRDSELKVRSFRCSNISEFVPKAEALAAAQRYDIIYVCKPRLPSLYLGALLKQASDCPLVLDVDDFELSFFKNENYASEDELKNHLHKALHEPFEELATRYCQTLVKSADSITISNVALRARFGGHIVRHARDENTFVNSTQRRQAARAELGITSSDFALMFIGTPRPHKGVLQVVKALNDINDPRLVFHIVGSVNDVALKKELTSFENARIVLHPNCAFERLPELLAGADLVPLIQDIDHPISQYQIPAKVSDALSLGVPVVATSTPPLKDLIASGLVYEANLDTLSSVIVQIMTSTFEQSQVESTESTGIVSEQRRGFLGELSTSVNRLRLEQAITEAQTHHANKFNSDSVVPMFGQHSQTDSTADLPLALDRMVNIVRSHYKGLRGEVLRSAKERRLIMGNLIDRQMGVFDTDIIRSRTHVFSRKPKPVKLLGKELYGPGGYLRFVNEQLEEHGMRARDTIAWFCPVVLDAPELVEKIGFRGVVADLIDDQRAWDATDAAKLKLECNYRDTLAVADVVFANCDSLADTMQEYVSTPINVIPNGAERFDQFPSAPIPASLETINGPIVGYVGNLRDRIDWTLLHEIVPAMPDVSFVFFGPAGDNPNADSLAKYDNVHVLGVVPYSELAFHLKSFNVGLVPHLKNELTERMNPLKVYNYFAAGLPIVSSEVANLGKLGSQLQIASNASEFISAIRKSIAEPVDTQSEQWRATMNEIAWDTRVGNILETMDRTWHRKLRKSA